MSLHGALSALIRSIRVISVLFLNQKNMPGTNHTSWTERLCLDGDFVLGENGNTLTLGKKDDNIMSD